MFFSELPYHEEFDHLLVMKEKLKIAMASDLPVGWEAFHMINYVSYFFFKYYVQQTIA